MGSNTRVALRLLLAVILAALLIAAYVGRIRGGMSDFEVYHRTGARLAAGENLYQTTDQHYMFKYLPSSALFYLPVAMLPMEAAKACWFALSLAALAGVVMLSARLVGGLRPYVMAISVAVLAKYFLHELRLGQINLFVTVLTLVSANRLLDGSASRAGTGAVAGLAVALKPYAALIVGYFAITRYWIAAVAAVVTVALAQLVPAVFFGVDGAIGQLRLWASTLSASTPLLFTNNDNISIIAFFTKWLGEGGQAVLPAVIALAVLAMLVLGVIVAGRRVPRAPALDVALLLTVTPLVSPLGWDYTLLMSLPAVMMIVNDLPLFPRPARIVLIINFAIIALAIYDVMGAAAYRTFMQWSVTTVNFLLVVLALAYLRFRALR